MKTIADFKRRIQVGVKFRQLSHYRYGSLNHVCVVTKVQTKNFSADGPFGQTDCWFDFPKRGEILFTERGWKRTDKDGFLISEYEWIEDAA